MTDELRRLWTLRALDEQVAVLDGALARLPEQRRELETRVQAERAHVEQVKVQLAALQLRRRQRERDIEAVSEQERKFQSQLPAVKKNEEYTALLHEITATKARRSEIETEVLIHLDEEDKLQKERPRLDQALQAAEHEAAERLRQLESEGRRHSEHRVALEAERSAELAHLTPATRTRYERIRGSRDGRAVVPILKGACGGCYRNQPPQVLQEARRADRLIVCEGCGRLLIWPPEAEHPAG